MECIKWAKGGGVTVRLTKEEMINLKDVLEETLMCGRNHHFLTDGVIWEFEEMEQEY